MYLPPQFPTTPPHPQCLLPLLPWPPHQQVTCRCPTHPPYVVHCVVDLTCDIRGAEPTRDAVEHGACAVLGHGSKISSTLCFACVCVPVSE